MAAAIEAQKQHVTERGQLKKAASLCEKKLKAPIEKLELLLLDARFELRVPANARMSMKVLVEHANKLRNTVVSLKETGESDQYDVASLHKDITKHN